MNARLLPCLAAFLVAPLLSLAEEPAGNALTNEKLDAIRAMVRTDTETSNADGSIRVSGDCLPFADKSVLLGFTGDLRGGLERILRARSAEDTERLQAVSFHGPRYRILLRGIPAEPTNRLASTSVSIRPYVPGQNYLPTLVATIENPTNQPDAHELGEELVDGLLRLKVLSFARPGIRPEPPARWFSAGLARAIETNARQGSYDAVRHDWFRGDVPMIPRLLAKDSAYPSADPDIAAQLVEFWLDAPDVPGRFRHLCEQLGTGTPWSGSLFLETAIGTKNPIEGDKAFDRWILDRQRTILSPGRTTPELIARTLVTMQLVPGWEGVPADFGDTPLPLDRLLDPKLKKIAPIIARNRESFVLRQAAGRGDAFRAAAQLYSEVLRSIAKGKPLRDAAKRLEEAKRAMTLSAE